MESAVPLAPDEAHWSRNLDLPSLAPAPPAAADPTSSFHPALNECDNPLFPEGFQPVLVVVAESKGEYAPREGEALKSRFEAADGGPGVKVE